MNPNTEDLQWWKWQIGPFLWAPGTTNKVILDHCGRWKQVFYGLYRHSKMDPKEYGELHKPYKPYR